MSQIIDLVKKYNKAWTSKDDRALSPLLQERFTFTGPVIQLEGREEMVECVRQLPFTSSVERVNFVTEGHNVVQTYDWVITSPFQAQIPTSELLEIKDGKIHRCRRYYDTAKLSKQTVDQLHQVMRRAKAA